MAQQKLMYELIWRVLRTKLPMALRVRQSKELEMLLTEPLQEGGQRCGRPGSLE